MGFSYRRRVRTGRNSWLNISKSGVSATKKIGRATVNSGGRVTIKLLPGLSYKFRLW